MIKIKTEQLDLVQRAAGFETTTDLARAMGLHPTSVARALAGKRQVGQDFVTGMAKAFPLLKFDDVFLVTLDEAIPA